MNIKKKYRSKLPNLSEYKNLCRKLNEIAKLQKKLLPLGFGTEICNGLVNFENDMVPICGYMVGDEEETDLIVESIAMELRSCISEFQSPSLQY